MSVHNISSIIFLCGCFIHLSLNWRVLTKYMASRTADYIRFKKEMIVALILVLGIVGLFSLHVFHVH